MSRRPVTVAAKARSAAAGRHRTACALVVSAVGAGLLAPGAAGAQVQSHAQYLGLQWGLSAIGAPSAWSYGTGAGVRIGIVDTGVDLAQQDLQGKVVAQTAIVSSPSPGCAQPTSAQDDNGHGTHVAGIAAATGAHGTEGVAPGASLVVAKVLDCQGSGTYQDVIAGINWAVSQGAKVINLSVGDAGTGLVDQSQVTGNPLASALQAAWNAGAIGVVAAGNNSNGVLGLGQANFSGIPAVVVAATGPNNAVASYSNTIDSAQWGVAAPGGDDPNGPTTPACGANDTAEILSTYWTAADPVGCYATDEGTSMATPFVSGTLALLLGRGLSPSQAVQALLSTANHSVTCGTDCSGLVNAQAAMASVSTSSSTAPRGGSGSSGASAPTSTHRSSGSAAPGQATSAAPASAGVTATTSTSATSGTNPTTSTTAGHGFTRLAAPLRHRAAGSGAGWWIALVVVLALVVAATALARRRRTATVAHEL